MKQFWILDFGVLIRKSENKKVFGLALCAVLFALCLPAAAQQPGKIPRIGYLAANSPSFILARTEAFQQGLRELGYVEGKNIIIEYRFADGKADRLPSLAAELVRLKVDVIVTVGPTATRPAKDATPAIPIVMPADSDPVGNGLSRALHVLAGI
jgi:putative tryptophan/tyrosine transport system substrate-binding protein